MSRRGFPSRRDAVSLTQVGIGAVSLLLLLERNACTAPQVNVGVTPGIDARPEAKVAFDGSISADVLFGRSGDRTVGVGPRVEVGTRAFDDLRGAAGLALLIPWDPLTLAPALHGVLQSNAGAFDPGVGGRLFVGFRPYNHYGWYSAALGLTLGADHVFATNTTTVMLGAQLDGMWLSLPFLFLTELLVR